MAADFIKVRTLATAGLTDAASRAFHAVLDDEERAQAARFAHPADRRAYVAAHGLMRRMIEDVSGVPAGTVRISADGPGGKPRLAWPADRTIDLNLSHARPLVAGVVGRGALVGIDCEGLDQRLADPPLAMLAEEERAWLSSQTMLPAALAFLHVWTLKEALLKAMGSGLSALAELVLLPLPPRLLRAPSVPEPRGGWCFRQWQPAPDQVVALAFFSSNPAGIEIDLESAAY